MFNVDGYKYCTKSDQKTKLIFTSTSEVYAGSQYNKQIKYPTPENTTLILPDLSSPRTSYMLSKIYGEAVSCFKSRFFNF